MAESVKENEMLYFRQLLAGRDFARRAPGARQMANFVYLIGDRESGETLAVDPAYAVGELLDLAAADGMKLTGVLATHYHPDHVGGDLMGLPVEGVADLLEKQGVKIHAQRAEAPWIKRVTGVSDSDLELHDSGDVVEVGKVRVELIHTPGHTPGSQCFLVENRVISGDTLFLEGCGRTDLPGGNPAEMYRSLTERLAKIPDDAMLFPGHLYSKEPSATMGDTRRLNFVLKPRSIDEWLRMFRR
jgi:glyoxylase-like metal-dependent hydrolase (beta-lactamase superfamily II)